MGSRESGVGIGIGIGTGESGLGNRDWGLETGESGLGLGNGQRTADSR